MSDLDAAMRVAWLQAADSGAVDEMRRLLSAHPELLNFRDRHQTLKASTALHLCAWRNHAAAAEFLLQMGADCEARDEAEMTPLHIDILRVCMEQMRPIPLLRSRCIDVSSPVALAKYRRKMARDRSAYDRIDTSTLEMLLKYKANVNSFSEVGESALLLAVDDGLIKHAKILLAHGADPYIKDKNGRMVLDVAAEHGYTDLVELFIKRNPELVEMAGERALRGAVCHDSAEVLELLYDPVTNLLSDPRDRLQMGGELFHTAIEYDAPNAAGFLLSRGIPVDWVNSDGETAVHIASKCCRPQLLEMLLARHADGNRKSLATGYSPYHMAVQHHGFSEVQVLSTFGANINLFDRNANTPLLFAAKNSYSVELMETLIRHGAHFLFQDKAGRDAVAPIIASWLFKLAPSSVPALVDHLLVSGCVRQDRSRCVISSLIWSKHMEEALLLAFLTLFSAPKAASHEALMRITSWLNEHDANVVIHKLLHDCLRR